MIDNIKNDDAYKTIGEITKELGLIDKKTGQLQTHTLRYWETQFKQLRPSIKAGNRRYYSIRDIKIIKKIKYLLKEKGLTINGAKNILNNKVSDKLDDNVDLGLNSSNSMKKEVVKNKLKKITKIIKELKKL